MPTAFGHALFASALGAGVRARPAVIACAAFFSPFDHTRYFFAWRPIAVSPLGLGRFFSERGLAVLASEAAWIGAPSLLLWVAARWRSRDAAQP